MDAHGCIFRGLSGVGRGHRNLRSRQHRNVSCGRIDRHRLAEPRLGPCMGNRRCNRRRRPQLLARQPLQEADRQALALLPTSRSARSGLPLFRQARRKKRGARALCRTAARDRTGGRRNARHVARALLRDERALGAAVGTGAYPAGRRVRRFGAARRGRLVPARGGPRAARGQRLAQLSRRCFPAVARQRVVERGWAASRQLGLPSSRTAWPCRAKNAGPASAGRHQRPAGVAGRAGVRRTVLRRASSGDHRRSAHPCRRVRVPLHAIGAHAVGRHGARRSRDARQQRDARRADRHRYAVDAVGAPLAHRGLLPSRPSSFRRC